MQSEPEVLTISVQSLCRYFGEIIDTGNEEARKTYCNSMCDVRD